MISRAVPVMSPDKSNRPDNWKPRQSDQIRPWPWSGWLHACLQSVYTTSFGRGCYPSQACPGLCRNKVFFCCFFETVASLLCGLTLTNAGYSNIYSLRVVLFFCFCCSLTPRGILIFLTKWLSALKSSPWQVFGPFVCNMCCWYKLIRSNRLFLFCIWSSVGKVGHQQDKHPVGSKRSEP